MLVLDANILVPLLKQGSASPVLQQLTTQKLHWCMPDLWRYELAHALRKLVRMGAWREDEALAAARRAELLMHDREYSVGSEEALAVALTLGLSGYDGAYVALARRLGCRLVTMDQEVLRKASGVAVGLEGLF